MSVPRLTVSLQSAARKDVRDLLAYTGRRWGPTQQALYNQQINEAFELLSRNPELGPAKPHLAHNIRAYHVQQHMIYYRLTSSSIVVVRILHQRMDASEHLA